MDIIIQSDGDLSSIDSSADVISETVEDVSIMDTPVTDLSLSDVCLIIISVCCIVSLFRKVFIRAGR